MHWLSHILEPTKWHILHVVQYSINKIIVQAINSSDTSYLILCCVPDVWGLYLYMVSQFVGCLLNTSYRQAGHVNAPQLDVVVVYYIGGCS